MRQAIEKQPNKVELANRFTRAVAVANPRESTPAEKEEQEIAEGRGQGKSDTFDYSPFAYIMGSYQHARRV